MRVTASADAIRCTFERAALELVSKAPLRALALGLTRSARRGGGGGGGGGDGSGGVDAGIKEEELSGSTSMK